MLVLPWKKADLYDTTKNLTKFLQKEYKEEAERFSHNVTAFQTVRNNAISVGATSGQLGFHNILRYNYHMNIVTKRLSGYEREIKFSFDWTEAFHPGKRIRSGNLFHDWACVLWNLAALESSRGSHEDRSTNDGVRNASMHFQQAAGIFSFLKTDVVPKIQGVKSQELSDNFLSVMLDLHLAQAQICFYEKAVRDKKAGTMKAGIVAKLAKQVAKFYEQAVGFARDKEVVRALDATWTSHMDFQRECFHGAAEYWQAQGVKEEALTTGTGYGEEITRLNRAEEIFTRTVSLGKNKRIHAASLSTAESFLDAVKRMKFTAAKDNATIYHDKVPESRNVADVAPVAMVRPAPLPSYPTNPNVAAEPPLFVDVLPKEVRSLQTLYRERVARFISDTESLAMNATNSGRAALSANGLPGSLEVYKSGGKFPSNLWKKIQNVQFRGGGAQGLANDLAVKVEDMKKVAERARSTIESIEYSLQREETIDENFRVRFPSYSMPRSSELGQDIRRNIQMLLKALDVAQSNDQTMNNRVQGLDFQNCLKLLSMSLPELESQLPQGGTGGSGLVDTSQLESCLVQIANLFEARETALSNVKNRVRDFEANATEAFCDATFGKSALSNDTTEALLGTQIQALEPLTEDVKNTLSEQERILQAVATANDAFNNARVNDPIQYEREKFIKELEQGIAMYSQTLSQISAGSTFYMDMQSRLTSLMQQCDDLSYTQQLQRQEFEVECMREQDRENQVVSDHDMALRLAEEMDRMNTKQSGDDLQQQQQQPPGHGYPQLQEQSTPRSMLQSPQADQRKQPLQQPPPQNFQGHNHVQNSPNNMNVAYGQPVSGPPPLPPKPPAKFEQQQSLPPTSHAYSSHFQTPAPNVPAQEQSTSSYVYNAGFNGGTQPQHQQSQSQYNPSYQPPQQEQQHYQQQPFQQNQQIPSHTMQKQAPPIDENKVARLIEMGFPRDSVVAYLAANNNNEEAALNGLLSGTSIPTTTSGNSNVNTQTTQPPVQPPPSNTANNSSSGGGFFSNFWGSSK